MESISLQQLKVVEDQLQQIREAIRNLELWNANLTDSNDLMTSPGGTKTLAADCMLIEASARELGVLMSGLSSNFYQVALRFLGKP